MFQLLRSENCQILLKISKKKQKVAKKSGHSFEILVDEFESATIDEDKS